MRAGAACDPNCQNADLSYADLYDANLTGANLGWANLYDANLYGANLTRANLTRANLSYADLSFATLALPRRRRASKILSVTSYPPRSEGIPGERHRPTNTHEIGPMTEGRPQRPLSPAQPVKTTIKSSSRPFRVVLQ